MASIPNNGYAAVMAGSNVYTGSNLYGSICPQTPIAPVLPIDLTNKLYVDTIAGGGSVVSVTGGTNITVAPTTVAPVVSLRNPLNADINLGTQNITGSTGQLLFSDPTVAISQSNTQSYGFSVLDTATATSFSNLTKSGLLVQTAADGTTLAPASIAKTGGGALTISSAASNIELNTPNVVTTSGSFKPATILDTFASAAGTAGQVLSSLGGAGTKWITNVATFGTLDETLASGNTATGSYATITLNDTDTGGQANPILSLNNTNATGSVALEVYKNKPTAGVNGDVLFNQSVYGKDSGNTKQEFTRMTHTIRDAVGGTEDGSIELSVFRAGAIETFLQINGVDNEVNCLKTLDMGGNNISTSTGNMTIVTTASTGTGTLQLNSKAATNITATTGGINLTANSGATIQANTSGSFVAAANTSISLLSTLGVMNMTSELHYGKMTTPYADQVYQPTYQPILTATTNTFPVAEIQREGQQVILINSAGDGANELTTISTPNFTITAILYKSSIGKTIVGGFNHIQGRAEIRCGTGINDVVTDITSGSFTYIAFPVNSTYYINVLYNSPLYPDTVAVGGNFAASTIDSYDGGANNYPSAVANFLCVDANTPAIVPLDMFSISDFTYGVDSEVITISAQSNTYYTPASQPVFILGGKFTNITTTTGPFIPANRTAVFCQNGLIVPFSSRWNSFINADNTVNKLWVYDDRVVFGGSFSVIGGSACPYLAFADPSLPFPNTSLINGFTPPAPVNAGFELSSPTSCYFGCLQDPSTFEYPVYQFDLTNMGVTPSIPTSPPIPANTLPAPATGFSSETGATLDFIVGHDVGTNNFCYKVQTPDFVDLNGATNLQNCFYDTTTVPTPAFFHQASLASTVPTNYYLYVPTTGQVSITTTLALPFVSATAPTNNWKTITLAARNNFATGTVVQFGTDDQRIVILASLGASFSN